MMTCLWLLGLISLTCVLGAGHYNQSSLYAGLSTAVATTFNAVCINFLTSSRLKENVVKHIAIPNGLATNVYSFDEFNSHDNGKIMQCDAPLQVVISHDEETRIAFMKHSHYNSMHGSDSPGGGIWLIFLESIEKEFLDVYFDQINTPFDVQLIVAELKENHEMVLKEVHRVFPDRPLKSLNLGKWTKGKEIQLAHHSFMHYSRRSDLDGMVIRVGYVLSDPYTKEEEIDGRMVLGGYLGDVWKILEKSLNVSTIFAREQNYGYYSKEKKRWSGLMQHVQEGDFDVGIADLTLTQKRAEAVSFSSPLIITAFQVYYHAAGSKIETGALFLPLATDLWLMLVGWIFIAALILYFGCRLSDRNLFTVENMTLTTAIFFVTGALCGQAGNNVPKTYTCRFFFIATFFITGVIIPAYSASLMSILTIINPNVPFLNMKEFYDNGKTRMMVQYSSYEYDIFAYDSNNDPYMNKIFTRDIEPLPKAEFPTSNLDAIQKVCQNPGLAFFGLADAIKYAIVNEEKREGRKRTCTITSMPMNFRKISLGIAFPKDSHIRGVINHHLSYLPQTGILKRLHRKHLPRMQPLMGPNEHQPVKLESVLMMFAVLGFGVFGSLVFLTIEIILGSIWKPKMPPKSDKIAWLHSIRRQGLSNVYNGY